LKDEKDRGFPRRGWTTVRIEPEGVEMQLGVLGREQTWPVTLPRCLLQIAEQEPK
jgi:hypothetical protein